MRVYNTLTGRKEEFVPLIDKRISFYVCGPTVYDLAHLGHGRSAVCFDVMRRYFEYLGFDVFFVSNYTDIDDKMINRASGEGISVFELAKRIIPEYFLDYTSLCVKPPNKQPLATEYIDSVISLIKRLEEKNLIYVLPDGVYFDVKEFPDYGKLSKQNLEDLKMGARIEVNKLKRNPYDFVLWKFKKEGEPFWASPWGEGRPGWHIECSAMSYSLLGAPFDIHGGGLDLVFPHHDCEIAQSEGAFGSGMFAKYWIHNGFINVNGEKMSKSLGNFSTLRDIFAKYNSLAVRLMFMQTHYRNPIEFSEVLLSQATSALERIHSFVKKLNNLPFGSKSRLSKDIKNSIIKARESFDSCMNDDFDTSGALGSLFEFIRSMNIYFSDHTISEADYSAVMEFLRRIDSVLCVIFVDTDLLDKQFLDLIDLRNEARESGDFVKADEIRDSLLMEGIILEDTPGGTVWKRKL